MPSNKDRLYVALYARGGKATMPSKEDTYHWALLIGPKLEFKDGKGVRFHAREYMTVSGSSWKFEELQISLQATQMLLVRIMIGKITNRDRLVEILRSIPIKQGVSEWNCVAWVREALEMLHDDGKSLGTAVHDWSKIRGSAMSYCQKKKDEHRFDGQADWDMSKPATFDLVNGKETIP